MVKRIILSLFIILSLTACKRDFFIENGPGELHFSIDTIIFDTIFTTIGSITKTLKVYNLNENPITISSINLANQNSEGVYRINVDGISTTHAENIKIAANDSIYIFVEATINPVKGNLPYLVTDSILFLTNGKMQDVDLIAYGQNANFYTPNSIGLIIRENENGYKDTLFYGYHSISENYWNSELPHVIYGIAVVEPSNFLEIEQNSNIYFHKNSSLIIGSPFDYTLNSNNYLENVNSGFSSLKIYGDLNNEVTFQGDRLDSWYEDIAGQWDRIWFTPRSIDNEINYAIIRNGTVGLHCDTMINNGNPKLIVKNTIIENMSDIGILAQGSNIVGENNVISDCASYAIVLNIGGTYEFKHCTFANYWSYSPRNTPSIILNNYYEDINGKSQPRNLDQANFTNCIISGSLDTEIELQENKAAIFNYNFNNCLLKLQSDYSLASLNENNSIKIQNSDSLFINIQEDNYQLHPLSPGINIGIDAGVKTDILNNQRIGLPDAGAYEKVD